MLIKIRTQKARNACQQIHNKKTSQITMKYELVNKIWSAYQTFLMNAQKLFAFNQNKML